MNIVVVDDSPDTAEMLRMLFEAQGHSVLIAFSGISGMELACVAEPDLLIVDVGLPDIDGLEVIRSLRSICQVDSCYFVVYSARDDIATRQRAREAGSQCFVVKGHDIEELVNVIQRRAEVVRKFIAG